MTDGTSLPALTNLKASVVEELGTAVKFSWDKPKDVRTQNWVYGIYYGLDEAETLKGMYHNLNKYQIYLLFLKPF